MGDLLSDGLFLPAVILAVSAWLVPVLLSKIMPEGVPALVLLAFIATLLMFVLSSALFVLLYAGQGAPLEQMSQFGLGENIVFFGQIGMTSAIIWGPIMLLSVANRPRHWTKAVW